MGQIVRTYQEIPQFMQSLTLGSEQYRLRLTWHERLGAWYADLFQLDDTPIILGQAVRSKWALGLGLSPENQPAGVFLFSGPDEYRRHNLGESLQLIFYPDSELPKIEPVDDGLIVSGIT